MGPGGTVTLGTGGGIGSRTWQTVNTGTNIEPNGLDGRIWFSHDANFTFPTIGLPYNSSFLVPDQNQDVVTTTYTISSNNIVASSTYPNPPPWSGVTTNYSLTNTVSGVNNYPGNLPGLVTNTAIQTLTCPSYPIPGSYLGSVITNTTPNKTKSSPPTQCYVPGTIHTNGATYTYTSIDSYTFIKITGYSYPTVFSYNYAYFQTNAVYSTNHYDYVFKTPGQYYLPIETFAGRNVLISANISLVLPSGLNQSGNDSITIASGLGGVGGGKLTLYVGGSSVSIGGNGILNQNGHAEDFVMYCANTVTSLAFNGNSGFIGVICAPSAAVSMNGSGNSVQYDFSGVLMAKQIHMNGHFNFHYDERLASSGLFGATVAGTLGSPPDSTNNPFQLTVRGALGRSYAVEASTNLINWVRQTTNLVPYLFVDGAPGNYRQRFFRTVLVP